MKRIRKENIFIVIFISLAFLLLLGKNDINLFKSNAEENLQQRVQYQLEDVELFKNEPSLQTKCGNLV